MTTTSTLLCIDTSEYTTIALVHGGQTLASATHESARHHAEQIAVLLQEVLRQAGKPLPVSDAGIDAIIAGTGPAPFTGLRAGLISAQVTAEVCQVPVYGVSSLDILARQALDHLSPESEVIAVSDARRKEIYWGRYRAMGADDVELLGQLEVGSATDLLASLGHDARGVRLVCSGSLPAHSAQALSALPAGPELTLDVAVAARIALARVARKDEEKLATTPLYLRRPEIHGQPMERM